MSRAPANDMDNPYSGAKPEFAHGPHPNYITPEGLEQLRRRLSAAERRLGQADAATLDSVELANMAREARHLQGRVAAAIPIDASARGSDRVGFGATVTVEDESGREFRYRIVGEDEADPERGLVSWLSPLARALEGAQAGDMVVWRRPAGDIEIEVVSIDTGSHSIQ